MKVMEEDMEAAAPGCLSVKDLPLAARIVCAVARRWPWWKGRARIAQCLDAALGDRRDHVAISLLESDLKLKVPLADSVARKAMAFAENDADLFRFLRMELKNSFRDSIYIDIGANLGVFLLRIAERFPSRCIGFEPQADLCELLRENAATNTLGGTVDIRHTAVGNEVGEVSLQLSPGDSGVTRVGSESEGVRVPITSLAAEFDPETWRKVAVIKIDVEGYELEVFQGARALFEIHRPTLVFEVNTDEMESRGIKPSDLGDCLREAGYTEFWALDRCLYPIRNGMFKVANVVAVGGNGSSALRDFGIDMNFTPKAQKYWPIHHYEF